MDRYPVWKPVLILAVLVLSTWSIWPVERQLKPGLDLAGGTKLIYQVDVPAGGDSKQVVEEVIDTLRKRVDPQGVRSLVWLPTSGNRIEIQMAQPSPDAARLRESYLSKQDKLLAGNLSARQVDSALQLTGNDRQNAFAQMAGANQPLAAALTTLSAANDKFQAEKTAYEAAAQKLADAEAQQKKLAADAAQADKDAAQKLVDDALTALEPTTRAYNQAASDFASQKQKVLHFGLTRDELDQLLAVPPKPLDDQTAKPGEPLKTQRDLAGEKLVANFPGQAPAIQDLLATYAAYEKVKGPLDDPNDLIALLQGAGVLEFRIAPQVGSLPDEEDYRKLLRENGPRAGRGKDYRWMIIDDPTSFADKAKEVEELKKDARAFFTHWGVIGQEYAGDYYLLMSDKPDESITKSDSNWQLTGSYPTSDDQGRPCVSFELNPTGGSLMSDLTGNHIRQPMTIILDGRVVSTATIQSRIADRGIITGNFTHEKIRYLVQTLNAGSLQARIGDTPISIQRVGPQLGEDNLRRGLKAGIYSFIVTAIFMGVYYLFWGMVANFALVLNILMLLAVMAMIEAAFTLPGIAGVVLAIGMAVDANVLIYERIREETERGVSLINAVRLGFEKAFGTILDSNLTTLITAVVLYYFSSADVKGFGLTLGVGIVISMFTAIFCTRVVVELYLRWFNPASLPMLPTIFPAIRRAFTPNVDWMSKRYLFFVLSGTVSVLGVIALCSRGADMLDIEFRSGTQVTVELSNDQTITISDARQRVNTAADKANVPGMKGAAVVTVGRTEVRDKQVYANSFTIQAIVDDADVVSNVVKDAFADKLDVPRPVSFKNQSASLAEAPVYRLDGAQLGQIIGRPEIHQDVSDYLGGVAVVLTELNPPQSQSQVEDRIQRIRLQPMYEGMTARTRQVIGLDLAAGTGNSAGEPVYRSIAVVARDATTNYVEDAQSFHEDATGLAATEWNLLRDALQRDITLSSVTNFSSQISGDMARQAVAALFLSCLAIIVYIWIRFGSLRWGLATVALVHDVTMAMGLCAVAYYFTGTVIGDALLFTDFKINMTLMAAVLTVIGYSINDTIVVFDRIRENRGRLAEASPAVINTSINQTFSRTFLTGGTTLASTLFLYVVGGESVRGFALVMFIGVVAGTYSSIAIAAPCLLVGNKLALAGESTLPATSTTGGATPQST